jgi:hypothetical protein
MKPGDKVVCVNAQPCLVCGKPLSLIQNLVYVIKEGSLKTGVKLLGVENHDHSATSTNVFDARRFRSLDEMKRETQTRNAKSKEL